jgi:hypothetical protein
MIVTDESTQRAMARLSGNPDFVQFMLMLQQEQDNWMDELLDSKNSVFVHQLQGKTRQLMDIRQAVMSAPAAVAAFNRR